MLEPGVDYPVVCAMRHLSHELIADFRWIGIGNSQFPSGITIESGEHVRATIRDARFFNGDDVGSCFELQTSWPRIRSATPKPTTTTSASFVSLISLSAISGTVCACSASAPVSDGLAGEHPAIPDPAITALAAAKA